MKQTERIRKYMLDFGSITQYDAFRDLGITRLSARIWDLRHQGLTITSRIEKNVNRYGEPVKYKRYQMVKENANETAV